MALATLVIFPLFWRGLPCSDDTLPHFFRAVQLDVNLRQGAPFLQWGPDLLRGYGYPIFAFYAPLTYWLLEALHLLGADFGPALQIAFAGSLWLAGWGAYVLARRTLAPAGAFVAGLAYLFAPYVLYDAIPRGALPELLALALLPWALAAIDRAQIERVRTVLVAALVLALLILTHNVVSIFGLALALLLAVAGLPRPAGELWRALSPAVAAIVLALGLTAFFWLPGVAELRYTQSSRPDPPIAVWPRFEQHLVPPVSLLALPEDPADPAQARVGRLRVLPATEPVDASALDAQRAAVEVQNGNSRTRFLTTEELQAGLDDVRQAPRDDGTVALIVRRPALDERELLAEGRLDPVQGLVGDYWYSRDPEHPEYQVTLINARLIALVAQEKERWALAGDQLYVDYDRSAENLPPGTRLAVGEAILEVSAEPHTGCGKFMARFGRDAVLFVNSPEGRKLNLRGINARVVQGGIVRAGDPVRKL